MDISAEIAAIQAASQGSELRQPLVGALNKLNSGALPTVTTSDAGKILKVGANGWEVGEKSGYMPVPTATKQITENGTHDVTDYASAIVNVSGGGGSILIPKTITQNGTYDPADDSADGYSEVIVNVSGGHISDNDLLFHFDNDFSNSGKVSSAFYSTTGLSISDEQSKFGGKSLKTGTTQGMHNVALNPGFEFGTNDFTLDFWCYLTSTSSDLQVPISFNYRSFAIYINQNSIDLGVAKTSGSWAIDNTTSISIPLNQWHHIAVTRDGATIYLFVNGIKIQEHNFGNDAIAPIERMTLGSNTYSSGNRRFNGYIDELRLKIGEAVWTNDFTPPSQPYT